MTARQILRDGIARMNARQHKEHAAANPPREGYACGPHAETFGGGCFNCGWKGPNTVTEKVQS